MILENYMRGNVSLTGGGDFNLEDERLSQFYKLMAKHNIFRCIANLKNLTKSRDEIVVRNSQESAEFVAENQEITAYSAADDFTTFSIGYHKLVSLIKLPMEMASDLSFLLEEDSLQRFAKILGLAEENAFINGNGINEPTGILHASEGATIGATGQTANIDKVIELFFSLGAEYRRNAVFIMNDSTALNLRKHKDGLGSPIWHIEGNETLLGKPVLISNFMPNPASGNFPIAFGDFSYYWICQRKDPAISHLSELFTLNGLKGYLCKEFIDGRLIKSEAVKLLSIS